MKNKLLYILTYSETLNGVFTSQLLDVAKLINQEFQIEVKLICLIPLSNFFKNKKDIKSYYPSAIVLPCFPKLTNWKKNLYLLNLTIKEKDSVIWARNPIACNLALALKEKGKTQKVILDSRGAFAAEFNEYITTNNDLQAMAYKLEANAVLKADSILTVSDKLHDYLQKSYKVGTNLHYTIPTTLGLNLKTTLPSTTSYFNKNDVVLTFIGGNADWQSFKMIDNFLLKQFEKHTNVRALIIGNFSIDGWNSKRLYASRIKQIHLNSTEIIPTLTTCDYGILLREKSITNSVAAPTKFAEYLLAGLPVLCSPNIGDYSEFITNKNVGLIITDDKLKFTKNNDKDRKRISAIAIEYFSKEKNKRNYRDLLKSVDLI